MIIHPLAASHHLHCLSAVRPAPLPHRPTTTATATPSHAVPPKAGTHGPQVAIYDLCLQRFRNEHTFMAFIDAVGAGGGWAPAE